MFFFLNSKFFTPIVLALLKFPFHLIKGKFAYLGARYGKLRGRNIDIDFGSSDLHTETTRTVELVNYSPVIIFMLNKSDLEI